jgi:hypothetical protein
VLRGSGRLLEIRPQIPAHSMSQVADTDFYAHRRTFRESIQFRENLRTTGDYSSYSCERRSLLIHDPGEGCRLFQPYIATRFLLRIPSAWPHHSIVIDTQQVSISAYGSPRNTLCMYSSAVIVPPLACALRLSASGNSD